MTKENNSVKPKAKLTKKELHAQKWGSANIADATAAFLEESMRSMSAEYGSSDICVAGKAGELVIGLPAPSISFEYLIQNNVYPCQRITQALGEEGSCKSAFGFEVTRWAGKCGGIGTLFETEKKYSPDYSISIIGWDDPNRLGVIPCKTMEDWQSRLLAWIDKAKYAMTGTKEKPGSGRTWPGVLIIDSIMGALSQNTEKDLDTRGYAERRFPIEAMKLTDYLKNLPTNIEGWPFLVIAVNHLKLSKDDRGNTVRGRAGGKQLSFGETFELEFSKRSRRPKTFADRKELTINITCFKNSLGETGRNIDVPVIWWHEPDPATGEMRQKTVWDWHASTTDLLMTLDEPGITTRLKEIVDLRRVNSGGIKIWSKALGIPESDPQTYHETGKAICKNKAIADELRKLFGIKLRKKFQKGVDYREQLKELKQKAMAAMEQMDEIPDEIAEPSEFAVADVDMLEPGTPEATVMEDDVHVKRRRSRS